MKPSKDLRIRKKIERKKPDPGMAQFLLLLSESLKSEIISNRSTLHSLHLGVQKLGSNCYPTHIWMHPNNLKEFLRWDHEDFEPTTQHEVLKEQQLFGKIWGIDIFVDRSIPRGIIYMFSGENEIISDEAGITLKDLKSFAIIQFQSS